MMLSQISLINLDFLLALTMVLILDLREKQCGRIIVMYVTYYLLRHVLIKRVEKQRCIYVQKPWFPSL